MKLSCPSCQKSFQIEGIEQPRFCPFCAHSLFTEASTLSNGDDSRIDTSSALVNGEKEIEEKVKFTIGPYQVIRDIGKGGMGEVFLAYDTNCGRRIALKRIRSDLVEHMQMHNRFLKEARITSQLTHPAIIPIYSIQNENKSVFYTMPFVEGNTLKEILRAARKEEKSEERLHHIGTSISALIRIFLSICQATAYAHSKNVLHRDLKPENIIVGKYGEVLILDWGLAKMMHSTEKEVHEDLEIEAKAERRNALHQLTHLGKIVGTLGYMAPERVLGFPASFQTDIYSLGVILYQILTLRNPFRRKNLKEFRQNVKKEVLYDPSDIAPYRDIPRVLSRISLKCLSPNPGDRYKSVSELIMDLENYIEGRSEWFQIAELNIRKKDDWEFQENILIAEHTAITRGTDVSQWVSLMISKASFSGNTKIEAEVKIGSKGHGLGFLFSIPEAAEREHLNDGYCLWLSSDLYKSTKLLRSTVEVMHTPDVFLHRDEWCRICVEKIDQNIHFYLNEVLQFSYISHLPLAGTHIGILSRDADFLLSPINVFVASQNVQVNCLAVPDAFLAHKDYATALNEYRRIGYSFPGRAEGREALFKAGISLLEEASNCSDLEKKNQLNELALKEFEKLHGTPGAPLEYLGKALVYETLKEYEEETKCFELAYRRYPNHPLLPVLQEQIVYRMHECSRYHRKATYTFILLTIRFLPTISSSSYCQRLFQNLKKHWEALYFFDLKEEEAYPSIYFAAQLAFWLAKPYVLIELLETIMDFDAIPKNLAGNILFCLVELGSYELAETKVNAILQEDRFASFHHEAGLLHVAVTLQRTTCEQAVNACFSLFESKDLTLSDMRVLIHCLENAIIQEHPQVVFNAIDRLSEYHIPEELQLKMDSLHIWAALIAKDWEKAGELLHCYSLEQLTRETTILHCLYGCWLLATEGKEIALAHFSGVMEISFPRTWNLLAHVINGKLSSNWLQRAFMWERRQLYMQQIFYSICEGDVDKTAHYQKLERGEYINSSI